MLFSQLRLALLTLILALPLHAQSTCKVESVAELTQLMTTSHPDIEVIQMGIKVGDAEIKKAKQRPNPVMNLSRHQGEESGSDSIETELGFQYVFEAGNKRNSRIKKAEARRRRLEFDSDIQKHQHLITGVAHLQRLSQVESLLLLYAESIEAFKKTARALRGRKLSPEQTIQLDMINLEVGKHRLRMGELEAEKHGLLAFFSYALQTQCDFKVSDLRIPLTKFDSDTKYELPASTIIKLESDIYKTDVDHEGSMSYPDIKIGPSFQWEESRGNKIERYGLALSFELPVLNLNGGGKAIAGARFQQSLKELEYVEDKNKKSIKAKLDRYNELITALNESPSSRELKEKHHRIENYFARGLLSISTMLDGHDQVLSAIEERDRSERLALAQFLELKRAEGKLEESLKNWSLNP